MIIFDSFGIFFFFRRILKLIREVSVRIIHGKNEGGDISLTLQPTRQTSSKLISEK